MLKIALDPHVSHHEIAVADELRKARQCGAGRMTHARDERERGFGATPLVMGTKATARVEAPRSVEWRTPGTPPRVTGRDALAAFDLAAAATES